MIIDSNIIIYSALPAYPTIRQLLREQSPVVSVISKVEVLGYHQLSEPARSLLESFFAAAMVLPVTDSVADEAIRLRQLRRMKLGDALIAATALVFGHTLVTRNVSDFKDIDGLIVIDPLADD